MDNKKQCRAEFEAWAAREGYAIEGEYPFPVDLMHKAWHAAWHRHAVAELAAIAKAATSPAPAVVQMTDLNKAILAAREALEKISVWKFGWDGDCGVTRVADDALEAIDAALAKQVPAQEQDTASIDQQFHAVANDVRFACMKLYSPDDTATDWADKMAELKLAPIIRAARAAQLAQSADKAGNDHD
jgi:hypothetical protein